MYMYQPSFFFLFYFEGLDSLTSNPRMHFLDSYMEIGEFLLKNMSFAKQCNKVVL